MRLDRFVRRRRSSTRRRPRPHASARESREISAKVEASAQLGVRRAADAMTAVTELAGLARDLVERMDRAARPRRARIGDVTTVVGRHWSADESPRAQRVDRGCARRRGRAAASPSLPKKCGKLAMQSGGSVGRIEVLVREMIDRIEDASGRVARMESAVKRGEQVMHEAVGGLSVDRAGCATHAGAGRGGAASVGATGCARQAGERGVDARRRRRRRVVGRDGRSGAGDAASAVAHRAAARDGVRARALGGLPR